MSIRVNHNNRDYRVVFEYYDADGVRFKKRDNANQPASWHRHPRSCSAFLEVMDEFGDWKTNGFAASFAHDGENFDRAEGRDIAFFRLINLIPPSALRNKLLYYYGGHSDYYSRYNEKGLNVKGEQINFWMDLEDEA